MDWFIGAIIVFTVIGLVLWFRVWNSKRRWQRRVQTFVQQHGNQPPTDGKKKDVLLIVCPASGGGNAMERYPQCVESFERANRSVQIYVTKSATDLATLYDQIDLKPYKVIAILAGDSSIYELVQAPLRQNNGKWPYAPILHLPGILFVSWRERIPTPLLSSLPNSVSFSQVALAMSFRPNVLDFILLSVKLFPRAWMR